MRDLEPAPVLEVGSDASRPEGVATDLGLDSGRERPPANHPPDIGLEQGIAGQLAGPAPHRPKERPLSVLGDAGRPDVLLEVAVQIVVGRHRVLLAALLATVHFSISSPDSFKFPPMCGMSM